MTTTTALAGLLGLGAGLGLLLVAAGLRRTELADDEGELLSLPGLVAAVAFGRLVSARQQVSDAAHQAARAASLSRDPATARRAAETTARQALAGSGTNCGELTVEVQLAFGPGGTARVRLSCTVDLADLQMLGVPGRKTLSTTATSPIDVYRSRALASGSSEVPWGANRRAGGEW